MRIQDNPPLHLTYCLNVHPGETWDENFAAIRLHTLRVRDAVCGRRRAFGLGLRLGMRAARQLAKPNALDEFRRFLTDENLYVFTINGFPYGQFHATAVKSDVYRPDWRTTQRRDYTNLLADILAELLEAGAGGGQISGSISTVPGSYKRWIKSPEDVRKMSVQLADSAAHLVDIHRRTGKDICLALEPEPDCFLGSVDETIAFLTGPLIQIGCEHLVKSVGVDSATAAETLQRHVGVCFDTSHMAVEFEDLTAGLDRFRRAGVRIAKIHLSAAIELTPTPAALAQLPAFRDDVYLHQVKARQADGSITSFADLPRAMDCPSLSGDPDERWRVHFHVPLYFERGGELESTRSLLTGRFAQAIRRGAAEHLEIETYTFDVLPQGLRPADVAEGITGEYRWVLNELLRS